MESVVEQEPLITERCAPSCVESSVMEVALAPDNDVGGRASSENGRTAMEVEPSGRDRESDLPYPRHAMPPQPRVVDYVMFYPRSVQVYFARLCARFGWRYGGPLTTRVLDLGFTNSAVCTASADGAVCAGAGTWPS